MKKYRAYKFRLYPNIEQQILINKTIGSARYVYNYFLNRKDNYYKETKENLSLKDIKHELVELKYNLSWLKEVDSMSLTNALDNLDRGYTNYFEKRAAHPIFKKKGYCDSYRTTCIKGEYKDNYYSNIKLDLKNKTIKLPKLGVLPIRGYRHLEKHLNIKNATIEKIGLKYYVSLCCEEEFEIKETKITHAIGIDLGVSSLVITSDGIKYPKLIIKRIEEHIKVYQERLSRCIKNSKNYQKIKIKIARLYQRIRNMRKFYIHEITNDLLKDNELIICETLKTKEMIEESSSKNLIKGIVNASFKEIERQLDYKTKWNNKVLIKVNTYYPSSKLCNHCGTRNEVNDLSIRSFECKKCKCMNDRDINASLNILEEGIKIAFNKGLIIV